VAFKTPKSGETKRAGQAFLPLWMTQTKRSRGAISRSDGDALLQRSCAHFYPFLPAEPSLHATFVTSGKVHSRGGRVRRLTFSPAHGSPVLSGLLACQLIGKSLGEPLLSIFFGPVRSVASDIKLSSSGTGRNKGGWLALSTRRRRGQKRGKGDVCCFALGLSRTK